MKISPFSRSLRNFAAIAVCLPLLSTAQAQIDGSWIATGTTSWSTSSNWAGSPNPVPGGASSTISLSPGTFANRGILLDGARVVGILNYKPNGILTTSVGTGGSLTFDNGASAAQINFGGQHSQTINAPIALNSSLNISTVDDTGTTDRTLSGTITAGGADSAKVITYTGASGGPGRLLLHSAISDGAGNRKVSVHMNAAGGGLQLSAANSFSGGVQVSKGTLYLEPNGSVLSANALGSGTLTLDGGNLRIGYFNSIAFGNETVIAADTFIGVRRSNPGAARTYTLGTLSIGNHTVVVSNTASASTSLEDKLVFGATTLTGNATFDVKNVASMQTSVQLGALNGAYNLTKTGNGVLELGTAAGSYSGTTQLNGGTLRVGNNTALGSGGAVVGGADAATLQINSGITVGNTITYSNTHADSSVKRVMANSTGFDTGTTGGLRSDLVGGIDTAVAFRASTVSGTGTLSMRFANTSTAENDANRISDAFSMEYVGDGSRTFVLQLSTGVTVPEGTNLGWLNDGMWKLATDGITGGSLAGEYNQSWTSFLADHGGSFNATTMLGAYGYDLATGTGWAVINRAAGEYALFAPVPEPSTWGLIGLGAGYLVLRRKRSGNRLG